MSSERGVKGESTCCKWLKEKGGNILSFGVTESRGQTYECNPTCLPELELQAKPTLMIQT